MDWKKAAAGIFVGAVLGVCGAAVKLWSDVTVLKTQIEAIQKLGGIQGPEGPQGPPGPQGPKGDPGAQGPLGASRSSEVPTTGNFKIVELTKKAHTRGTNIIQAFVSTDSSSTYVLCQTVTAHDKPEFVREVYCHYREHGGNDGIYIHVQTNGGLPADFKMSLLVLQSEAKRYGEPIYAG